MYLQWNFIISLLVFLFSYKKIVKNIDKIINIQNISIKFKLYCTIRNYQMVIYNDTLFDYFKHKIDEIIITKKGCFLINVCNVMLYVLCHANNSYLFATWIYFCVYVYDNDKLKVNFNVKLTTDFLLSSVSWHRNTLPRK